MGMDVILVGPLPTPAMAMLTRSLRADLGVMISASHNPYQDNGLKFFGPDGHKLSDAVEQEIEAHVDNGVATHLAASKSLGRAMRLDDAQGRYTEFVKQTFPRGLTLEGLKIVVDCANGAAYKVAPEVLVGTGRRSGADRGRSRWLQHQPGVRLDLSRKPCAARSVAHGAAPRHRAWTVMPTGW